MFGKNLTFTLLKAIVYVAQMFLLPLIYMPYFLEDLNKMIILKNFLVLTV